MSDAVTNPEVEDVLSSIRRLVSEDGRTAPKADSAQDRLVLTPALRVSAPEEDTQPETSEAHNNEAVMGDAHGMAPDDRTTQEPELSSVPGPTSFTDTARFAAVEQAVAQREDHWEPDAPGETEYAGTEDPALVWEDTSPVEEEASPAPETQADQQATVQDEDLVDEAALREIVAEIVREELQGPLGARITRNVRKLVRREIHRALAAKDLG